MFFIVLPPVLTCRISPCCSPYGHSFSFEFNWNYWTIILPIFAYDASNVSYSWPFLLSKHRGFFNRPAHELTMHDLLLCFFYIKCTIVSSCWVTNLASKLSKVLSWDFMYLMCFTGAHWHQFSEHWLLLAERGQRSSSESSDRHLWFQLREQPSHSQSCLSGQDLLR